jgi:YaiO family outer membrane protein
MRPNPVALALAALLPLAAPAAAQEPVPVEHVAAIDYSVARFDGGLDPWHLATVELLRRSGFGAILARASVANRFGETGRQYEAEAYPRLGERAYAYLNAGWSPSEIFPKRRYGAELFVAAAPGVELSAGARRLEFEVEEVTLYTASAATYLGRWYLSARPFVSPRDGELLASGTLLARRYLATEREWLALSLGGGEVPSDEVTAFDLQRLRALRVELSGRHALTSALGARWAAGAEWEELPADGERRRVTAGAGLEVRF